ncbi:uncharacterized protein LOC131153643 [Malania oleifera]|uniref:uncharacterized protein LOC131153643 n=1 Tax=Malania oleifera TaxID=397392 RepID=UPI0025AE9A4C|nr:uncharacterized protein LOC131153643 [Malania oleifera]
MSKTNPIRMAQKAPLMASLPLSLPLHSLPSLSCSRTLLFLQNPHYLPSFTLLKPSFTKRHLLFRPLKISFALTDSDSPKSLGPDPQTLLKELVDSFNLPPGYLGQLPRDLRLDLNDAAFDLSNGPVIDECGQELGEILLNLSRAWEMADTSASHALVCKLPLLESSLPNSAKSAFGKRLLSAGRRFQSMGQYGRGELQRIAKAMTTTGKLLSAYVGSTTIDKPLNKETRILKFGELQVEITPDKANIGAVIGLIFGILSWQLAQGVQGVPESTMVYANDNALAMAKSLRGALLVIFYSSTFLSSLASVGLLVLGRRLSSKEK